MSIVKYNSTLNEFVPTNFSNLIDRFFSDSVARSGGSVYSFVPRVDVIEEEKAFEIHLAVPGMNKEDFKIDLNDNYLTISGERKLSKESKEKNFFRSFETQYGSFSRSFSLPETVAGEKITAQYTNGILVVSVPKDEKKVVKQSIKVN
ncbi:MAG TPA: Hsp20/alpha crystallin family protein [Cyclobacteriaceae bacterium]|nr:Hsp20/alpha crystallin family protein [Cyclobacteriaceae bacterium]